MPLKRILLQGARLRAIGLSWACCLLRWSLPNRRKSTQATIQLPLPAIATLPPSTISDKGTMLMSNASRQADRRSRTGEHGWLRRERRWWLLERVAPLLMLLAVTVTAPAAQEFAGPLPEPLTLEAVTRIARDNRSEVLAMDARADALAQRPVIDSALDNPMLSSSIDHWPFDMMDDEASFGRYDWSISIEQSFPLSRVRSHRRRAASAAAVAALAEVEGTRQDVALSAQRAYFMLLERRRMSQVATEQLGLSKQLVAAASSRYASGTGVQADLLRAEVEVARAQSSLQSLAAKQRAAEAMLNSSIGRQPEASVPELDYTASRDEPAGASELRTQALMQKPELQAGEAGVQRALAEIDVMRSMYSPMATVRLGRASTMSEGPGAMVMFGVSLPIGRPKLKAGVAEAQAMERMARADLEAMKLMAESQAVEARELVVAARAEVLLLDAEVIPRARVAVDAALAGYQAGQGTLITVIEAARTLWEVRAELVMAESALSDAWARLSRATGQSLGANQ